MKTLLCTLILATLGAAAAQAATITITLDQPNQFATPGTTVDFFGTITNNTTGTIFLNSDSFNLSGASLTLDDSPFFANAPFFLASGANSGDIEIFDVSVSNPLLDAAGFYAGSFSVLGGVDGNASVGLGSVDFSVDTAPTSRVSAPERPPSPAITPAASVLPEANTSGNSRTDH